ncbi:hypothetical protein [Sulfurimonas sp.]|nr:hypothetical protein [Sulfurimonas sp.]
MKTLFIIIAICSVIYAGKGAVFQTIKVQNIQNQEISKAIEMMEK